MYKRVLKKRDGRNLTLYGQQALPDSVDAPSPIDVPSHPNSHLRWHPLRGEWIAYASHRQGRTFLPPSDYNPLAPTVRPDQSTEVPNGRWDIAVFDNLFPALSMEAHAPPKLSVPTRPGIGACEVVVFTQDSAANLGTLSLPHLELLIDVWADRYDELGRRPEIAYVYPFENRGTEVGVTLHHPHGQIYGYPFVPPLPARELHQQRGYFARHARSLVADIVAHELSEAVRLVYRGNHVAAFMPVCARYSYEVWIAPMRPAQSFAALTRDERREFARALKTVVLKYDGLWNRPFPYILAFHQAPTDGVDHPEAHLHAEFYPALRMPGRLKYLAGSEIGAGVFTADTLPEEKVRELQAVVANLDE